MQKMLQQRNSIVQAQGNEQPVQDRQTQPPQTNQGQTPRPNAANLQQQQQQQQALQAAAQLKLPRNESHRQNRAPAAPTAAQPPFLLGARSPDGTPHAYGPTVLTQDQLKFPPPKKRKPNQQGSTASTPAQVQAAPAASSPSQMVKIPSPEAQRQQAVPQTFKCSVGNCDANKNGFGSQADLAKHTLDVHEPKEPPIDDPLAWAMESVRLGLGLHSDGKMKPKQEEPKADNKALEAPKMKLSTSQQGQTPIKQEVGTPAGQTAVPMSRPSTQTGPSPASQMLKTPQASTHVKTPASGASGVKPETVKETKAKSPAAAVKEPQTPPIDLWADSPISPASLSRCFSGLSDLQSIPWSEIQNALTPPSTLSSAKSDKNSPRASDISESDNLNINISDLSWMPNEWFDDRIDAGTEGLDIYRNDDLMDLDWETAFGNIDRQEEVQQDGKGKKKDEWAPSPAFDPSLFSMRL